MTQQHSYLIFRINNSFYAVSTLSVKEIFLLPELTPILEAPSGIVGVIDVRGQILPVMDLNLRFGQQINNYSLTTQVIVLEQEEQNLGIIVEEVSEVRDISAIDVSKQPVSDRSSHPFIAGVVRSENDIIVIINLANLIEGVFNPNYGARQNHLEQPFPLRLLPSDYPPQSVEGGEQIGSSLANFSAQLTSEALEILRERANRLRQIDEVRQNEERVKNLAIVVLNQEFFSVDLENVREFTNLEQVVPVPCCPPHIIGNMNLRGEILTLIDICQVLNLPPINLSKISQLIVVEVDDLRVGLAIEKVHDTISVDAEKIDLAPAASYSTNKKYFQGTLFYQKNMVSILNIASILQSEHLIVDRSG